MKRASRVYYPIVEFQTYRCKGQSGTYPAEYAVNETVTVHYDPAKPTNTFVGTLFSLFEGSLFSLVLKVLFSWFGLKVLGYGKPPASTGNK